MSMMATAEVPTATPMTEPMMTTFNLNSWGQARHLLGAPVLSCYQFRSLIVLFYASSFTLFPLGILRQNVRPENPRVSEWLPSAPASIFNMSQRCET